MGGQPFSIVVINTKEHYGIKKLTILFTCMFKIPSESILRFARWVHQKQYYNSMIDLESSTIPPVQNPKTHVGGHYKLIKIRT